MKYVHRALLVGALAIMAGCASQQAPVQPATTLPAAASVPQPPVKLLPKPKLGLALGGGAAKGFAHIGVIKALEAQGYQIEAVSGTSAGSVVGALYASGLNGFQLQEKAFGLDETQIRDLTIGGGGLVKGEKLQDFVNQMIGSKPIEKLNKPFAAVATDLDSGNRIVFRQGNTGQAVRASSSIPGVFQPVVISGRRYVDGGVVSPVPVDAAREMGADIVIAVDISAKAKHGAPAQGIAGIANQAVTIMGQKLGELELARADVVIQPRVGKIGAADFDLRNVAILEGEKATQAALPQIREKIERWVATHR
ncbi:patatin-like phospholipase family protein [Burkholderiaceae bacterium DAT-1]|nr:patatin-like phospholipase family protein [Burkholderiaceae bacterium DAT-1]